MKLNAFHGAAIVSFLFALLITVRITLVHGDFQSTVRQSLSTSEGYDQKFIDLVNHLEDVLTTRASFSYPGGRDPMTGRQRVMAEAPATATPPAKRVAQGTPQPTASGAKAAVPAKAPTTPTEAPDPFKLTALIADDFGRYTAIVMNGERSMSVDVGDAVGDKTVARISAREIVLETSTSTVTYGLNGSRTVTPK
jgi:hypothetical protein